MKRKTLSSNLLAPALVALTLFAVDARAADDAESAIRAVLVNWTNNFNAGKADVVCDLFDPELRYEYRGFPERGYRDICKLLQSSLADDSKTYAYSLDIQEVLVSGNLAVVRLVWTLKATLGNGQEVTSVEPGMDVFRRAPDGTWKIFRYLAYEAPGPAMASVPPAE